MKIVNFGDTYEVYTDEINTYDELPPAAYQVCFTKMRGFYLTKYPFAAVNEKIYGKHREKADKVLDRFKTFDRNLGVILSGAKGIGKSICAKLIANNGIKAGLPVILINDDFPGLANFLTTIEQECIMLFDEFDKVFSSKGNINNNGEELAECNCNNVADCSSQNTLLTLFDGMASSKKIFVITCNNLNNISDFLVNRPGRFHFHFRFDYPEKEEIREYMEDNLFEKYHNEINKVLSFAEKVDLNYDCLRAIAFELNLGTTFEDAIADLNIVNVEEKRYNVYAVFMDGTQSDRRKYYLDRFTSDIKEFYMNTDTAYLYIKYNPIDIEYDDKTLNNIIPAAKLNIDYTSYVERYLSNKKIYEPDADDFETKEEYNEAYDKYKKEYEKEYNKLKNTKFVKHLVFERVYDKNIHYAF